MDDRGRGHRAGAGEGGDAGDLAVPALTTAEALLVWGMRHWVACLKSKADPIPLLVAGFGSGGAGLAVKPLEEILLLTLHTATVPRDVRCTHCVTLGGGELDLLAAVALEQAGRPADSMARLREWLPPASARVAKDMIAELAHALHDRALMVPLRREYGAWRPGGSNNRDHRLVVPASLSVH